MIITLERIVGGGTLKFRYPRKDIHLASRTLQDSECSRYPNTVWVGRVSVLGIVSMVLGRMSCIWVFGPLGAGRSSANGQGVQPSCVILRLACDNHLRESSAHI